MKKFLVSVLVFLSVIFTTQNAIALDYSKISTNAKVTAALDALYTIKRRDVIAILYGQNATRKPVRIMFRDLNIYGYGNSEAVTTKTKSGSLVIYINSEHKGASPECLACLIAHEAQHHTYTNTKAEELRAWISENQAWNEFVKRDRNLALKTEPLAKRENYIAKIRAKGGVQGVQKLIATNPVYKDLN